MKIKPSKNSGFTLIELMVATSIFMMVILAAIGALMITSNAAKQSKALRYAMDNVNFAMDTMTRNIRLGSDYFCATPVPGSFIVTSSTLDCASGDGAIVFTKPNSTAGSFDLSYQIAPSVNGNVIEKCDTSGCTPITSKDVNITELKFIVRGSDPLDPTQPSVKILLKGSVDLSGKITTFELQSLASQRTFK